MANPPSIQRFYAEDYKDSPSWFKKFISTLNLFTFPVYTGMDGNLNAQNLNIQYYQFNITGGAAATNNTVTFTPTISGTPTGVTLLQTQIVDVATPVYNTAAIDVSNWTWNGKQITINSIPGLTSGTQYTLTVKVE